MTTLNDNKSDGERGIPAPACSRPFFPTAEYTVPRADEKLAALLSYLLWWITGLVFYYTGKGKFVKFHAVQSMITFGAITIFQLLIKLIRETLMVLLHPHGPAYLILNLCGIISAVVWVGSLVLWAFLMSKAYQGENFQLPIAGDFAAKQL